MMWGIERRAGTTALLIEVQRCRQSGKIGNGELQAMIGNLKAATMVAAPVLYSAIYDYAKKNRLSPGLPFVFAALSCVAAEALHRFVPDSALASSRYK